MSSTDLVTFIALLVGAFLFIVALLVFQEARRRPAYEPLEYVLDDAVKHVAAGLEEEGNPRLRMSDVRRILEWELFYLQGLAQDDRSRPVEVVAGGHEASVRFIVDQIAMKHGVAYPEDDVEAVLRHEADYLVRIGAVGEAVDLGGEEE